MMRFPTITTLLSLVVLFNIAPPRAIASQKTESLTTEKEGNFINKSNPRNSIYNKRDNFQSKQKEEPKQQNFLIPLIPGSSRFSTKPAQPELFSQPFYSGIPQKQKEQKNISEGSRGAEVWAVQRRLQARGFNPGNVDSIFGKRTTEAVKAFQKSLGFSVTGIVDDATWTALAKPSFSSRPSIHKTASFPEKKKPVPQKKILERGDRGTEVKNLQVSLKKIGFNPGPIDGIFGMKTKVAVKKFQKSQGINPDGIVNQKTWEAFRQKQEN
ncbi:MAG: peptidoglycan-binding protein [Trichodesmium sp.]